MEQRSLGRIKLTKLKNISAHFPSENLKITTFNDINSGGLAFPLNNLRETQRIKKATEVKIFCAEKYIARKFIKKINVFKSNNKNQYRIGAVFKQPFLTYLPKNILQRVEPGYYELKEGMDFDKALALILSDESPFLDKRKYPRIRLSYKDNFSLKILDSNNNMTLESNLVENISSEGTSCQIPETKLSAVQNIANIIICYKNEALSQRAVKNYFIEKINKDYKLRLVLEDGLSPRYIIPDSLGFSNDGIIRITEKENIDKIIQAVIANQNDIQINILKVAEKEKIYKLRYEAYLDEGKVTRSMYPNCKLKDKYDKNSILLGAYIKNRLVASMRVVFKKRTKNLEVEENYDLKKFMGRNLKYAEVSRFCVDKYYRKNFIRNINLSIILYLEVYKYARKNGLDYLVITSYKPHEHLYEMLGFRKISDYIDVKGFKYKYVVMVVDLHHYEKYMYPLIYPLFKKVDEEHKF